MLRFQFRRHAIQRVNAAHLSKRRISSEPPPYKAYFPRATLPPVRILGPTIWCFGVAGIIYVACASYEVYGEKRGTKGSSRGSPTSDTTPMIKGTNLTSSNAALVAIAILNTGIRGANHFHPATSAAFVHIPAGTRNFTMLTSMFGHIGGIHFFLNMYALLNFGPPLGQSPTFNSSGSHLTAFYLCSGLFASLGQHLRFAIPNNSGRLSGGLGASGAIMAILGAWAMNYPDNRIGIILIPGSLPAQEALGYLIAFETWGTVFGYPFIRLGHAAHLAGLLCGLTYVHYDGKKTLWEPTKRFAFKTMRRLNVV